MRKAIIAVVLSLGMTGVLGALAYVVLAQADHQVSDKGYIEIGSYTETAAKKRPAEQPVSGLGSSDFHGQTAQALHPARHGRL